MNRTPDDATRLMNLLVAICGESVRHLVEAKVWQANCQNAPTTR
jgi:hypothetical protein